MLLPYECHISNTNLQECLTLYELKGSPAVNNLHEGGGDLVNNSAPGGRGGGGIQQLPGSNNNNALMPPFNEDSQNSLDGLSNQPLPDISVQEAEFVLGIPPNSNQATPSQSSFPPNANWSDFMPNQPPPPMPPDERSFPPSQHASHIPGHPGMVGGDPSFMFPSYNDQFSEYRSRMQMSHFMNRQSFMGGPPHHPSPQMDPGGGFGGPAHYPPIRSRPPTHDGHYNSMEWQWSQQRPHLPPPLPPHLQSMAFSVPHSSPSHPSPVANSSRPSTPQSVPLDRASPHRPPGNQQQQQPGLDPIKIQWQDQQHASAAGNASNKSVVGGGVMTPPPSSQQHPPPPVSKEAATDKDEKQQQQQMMSLPTKVWDSLTQLSIYNNYYCNNDLCICRFLSR